MIAMALAGKPKLLLADEPTTALDVSLRQQILDLLDSLQEKHGMAILLITHDLNMVRRFADKVVVLEGGYNVPAVARGLHACTAALLGAVEEEEEEEGAAPAAAAGGGAPSEVGARCVRETADALREFWPCLRG
jgi:microcin C transport system ATP-binding protein